MSARPPIPVLAVVLAAAAVAALPSAGTAGALPSLRSLEAPAASGPVLGRFAETSSVRLARPRRMLASQHWWGGAFAASTGERVTVYVSRAYPEDAPTGQSWADFFASLLHAEELGKVTAYVAPPLEVAEICGDPDALGCYAGGRLVTIGDSSAGVPPAVVATHEYGHHVAAHRANPPWSALDWGTKRWSSHANVCGRVAAGTAFPGDEGDHYALNPGEAFAEAYRVLNEARAGATEFDWPIVDRSFFPDAEALARVEQDVVQPWTQPPSVRVRGRFARSRRAWTLPIATPLDGLLTATLRMPLGGAHELTLARRGTTLARGLWSGSGRKSVEHTVCGDRELTLRLARGGTDRRFTVEARHP